MPNRNCTGPRLHNREDWRKLRAILKTKAFGKEDGRFRKVMQRHNLTMGEGNNIYCDGKEWPPEEEAKDITRDMASRYIEKNPSCGVNAFYKEVQTSYSIPRDICKFALRGARRMKGVIRGVVPIKETTREPDASFIANDSIEGADLSAYIAKTCSFPEPTVVSIRPAAHNILRSAVVEAICENQHPPNLGDRFQEEGSVLSNNIIKRAVDAVQESVRSVINTEGTTAAQESRPEASPLGNERDHIANIQQVQSPTASAPSSDLNRTAYGHSIPAISERNGDGALKVDAALSTNFCDELQQCTTTDQLYWYNEAALRQDPLMCGDPMMTVDLIPTHCRTLTIPYESKSCHIQTTADTSDVQNHTSTLDLYSPYTEQFKSIWYASNTHPPWHDYNMEENMDIGFCPIFDA